MAHEMTENDSAVYYKDRAWHGLGTVLNNEFGVEEAYNSSGLDWRVRKSDGLWVDGYFTEDHCGLTRSDTSSILGVVSPRYKIVQNREVFDIADSFSSIAKVESAGSIQDGRKCYVLLRSDSFIADRANDVVEQYMAMFWGHDGTSSIIIKPTSVRVVCKNTMDMALEMGKNSKNQLTIKHSGDIDSKLEEARNIVAEYTETGTLFREKVQTLAARPISHGALKRFFTDVYQTTVAPINLQPVTAEEDAAYKQAVLTVSRWDSIFETESTNMTPSWWLAVNAVTNDIQHREGARGRKSTASTRAYSQLNGKASKDSSRVMNLALAM